MSGRLGIIAGGGALPAALADADPRAFCIAFEGAEVLVPENRITRHRMERLGTLFDALQSEGVTRVVLAGAMSRPSFDPAALDVVTTGLLPHLMAAMQQGDDHLLRFVIGMFEDRSFTVIGAADVLPDLTAEAGVLVGEAPAVTTRSDIARGRAILEALSPHDVGQGCVVASGLCLGIETLQGTDALLRFVAETPEHLRRRAGGVLIKRPKTGQDLRVDMPAIGPQTIRAAAKAGLDGIAIAAGSVMLLDREALLQQAAESGVFLLADP